MNVFLDKGIDFIIGFLASLFVVFVVLLIERSKRPKIEVDIETIPPITKSGQSAVNRKFLRVAVHNRRLNKFLDIFYTREPALNCQAWITFLHEDNTLVFSKGHRMQGRWSRTPEPITLAFTEKNVIQYLDTRVTTDSIDIPPNSFEYLDTVMRPENSDTCIGWHNGIIENPDPKAQDSFDLSKGRYHILIQIRTGGRDYRRVFRLVNDGSFDHFRLENLTAQPKIDTAYMGI